MRALTELKKECFSRIGSNICFCCGKSKLKQLLAHHLSYNKNSVIYNKFENSDDGRLKYYSCLLDEIKQDPYNFLVLCMNCHAIIEDILKMDWIDAYNFCNGNNGEYNMYEKAWKMSYDKRDKSNLLKNADEMFKRFSPKLAEILWK